MNRYLLYGLLAAALLPGAATLAVAADQDQPQTGAQTPGNRTPGERGQISHSEDQIYGSQLMSPEERSDYLDEMRNLKTERQREQFRIQHREQMQERARELGVSLPDEPSQGSRPGSVERPDTGRDMGPPRGMMGPGGGGRP